MPRYYLAQPYSNPTGPVRLRESTIVQEFDDVAAAYQEFDRIAEVAAKYDLADKLKLLVVNEHFEIVPRPKGQVM